MKKVEFVEKVLLIVLRREILRRDYVIGRKVFQVYPYQEAVTLKFVGGVNSHILRILTEYFVVSVIDGEVCLSAVRGQRHILAALDIKLT